MVTTPGLYGIMIAMNLDAIIGELTQERNRIDQALSALQQSSGTTQRTGKRRGRPPGSKAKIAPNSAPAKRRKMSAAARKKISEAAKKRWAARKAADKKAS